MSWTVTPVRGTLTRRNASAREAAERLTIGDGVEVDLASIGYSHYLDRAIQGATLAPRPFWFVVPDSTARDVKLRVRTDPQQRDRAKDPWRGVELEGEIEQDYIFATTLEVFPYRLGPRKLCALPVSVNGNRLTILSTREVTRRGASGLSVWLTRAEEVWNARKKSSVAQNVTLPEYLDNHRNLTRQRLSAGTKLVYGGKGTHVRAAVIDPADATAEMDGIRPRGYVFDMNMYYINVETVAEAHYLAGILNTPYVDDGIKASQTQGAWGARDIHRRPFEMFPVPRFDASSEAHQRLAAISVLAHERIASETTGRTYEAQVAPIADLIAEANGLARDVCELLPHTAP